MTPDKSLPDLDRAHLIHPLTHPRHFECHHPPRIIVEGKGMMIRDLEGREIVDGFSGLWCVAVGHNHPKIIEAVTRQMNKLSYFSSFHGHISLSLQHRSPSRRLHQGFRPALLPV